MAELSENADLREIVRERYAAAADRIAEGTTSGCACGPSETTASCCSADADLRTTDADGVEVFGAALYGDEAAGASAAAVEASLGCGVPTAIADLHAGETVLDLGSGAGADVLISAGRVGPTGRAIGLDMTDEMLALARANADEAGATNVEFLKGHIEDIPLPAGSVDVVISNCVINLSTDKPAVLAEIARVLKPGGRIGISDVVAEDHLSPADRAERGSFAGCIAGSLSRREYLEGLAAAGFVDAEVTFTHEAAPGIHGAIIRASKPTG